MENKAQRPGIAAGSSRKSRNSAIVGIRVASQPGPHDLWGDGFDIWAKAGFGLQNYFTCEMSLVESSLP
jgi:hypothetical protein